MTSTMPLRRDAARRLLIVSVALLALVIDVASKAAATSLLAEGPVGVGPIMLRLVHNSGFALGLGAAAPRWVILGITAAVAGFVFVMAWRGGFRGIAAGLLVGGAIANVADRAFDGTVVDWIDVGAWPTFNLADAFILAGLALMLLGERRRTVDPDPSTS